MPRPDRLRHNIDIGQTDRQTDGRIHCMPSRDKKSVQNRADKSLLCLLMRVHRFVMLTLLCEDIHCSPVFRSYRSDPISCPNQGYVRRLPSVKYIQNGAVVRNVSIETFRATGGFALSSLRATDVNHNDHRAALQFSFWQPVTIASMRLVQIRVCLLLQYCLI